MQELEGGGGGLGNAAFTQKLKDQAGQKFPVDGREFPGPTCN